MTPRFVLITVAGVPRVVDLLARLYPPTPGTGYGLAPYGTSPYGSPAGYGRSAYGTSRYGE